VEIFHRKFEHLKGPRISFKINSTIFTTFNTVLEPKSDTTKTNKRIK
jgi:hypothetical protein